MKGGTKVEYCWARDDKTYEELVKIFDENDIKYELSIEKVRTGNHIIKYQKIYIFHVKASSRNKVDRILSENSDRIEDEYCLSRFVKVNAKLTQKEDILSLVSVVLFVISFVTTVLLSLTNSRYIAIALLFSMCSIIFFGAVYAKKHPMGIMITVCYEAIVVVISSLYFYKKYKYDYVSYKVMYSQLLPFVLLLLMIAHILIQMIKGIKRYQWNCFIEKIQFIGISIGCMLVIVATTIINYGLLYQSYHEDVYFYYSEKCHNLEGTGQQTINFGEGYRQLTYIEEKEADSLKIMAYYAVNSDKDYSNLWPYKLDVFINDDLRYHIEPGIYNIDSKDSISNYYYEEYLKFSLATYLGTSYGDTYTGAEIIKEFALQESLIAKIMEVLVIASILAILQKFINNMQEEKCKMGK